MVSTEAKIDPYTLVATFLQESPASRSELRVLTELDPELIDAAIHRFDTMGSVTKFMKGGEEHYRWKQGVELPEPSNGQRLTRAQLIVPDDASKAPRPKGWSLAVEVRSIVDGLPDGAALSMPTVYDELCRLHANVCETYNARDLRTQITVELRKLVGKAITALGRSGDSGTCAYRKGVGKVATVNDRNNNTGDAIPDKTATLSPTQPTRASAEPLKTEALQGNISQDSSAPVKSGNFITEIITPPSPGLADFSSSSEAQKEATIQEFLAGLRAERDELESLILLIEKRLSRGGGLDRD